MGQTYAPGFSAKAFYCSIYPLLLILSPTVLDLWSLIRTCASSPSSTQYDNRPCISLCHNPAGILFHSSSEAIIPESHRWSFFLRRFRGARDLPRALPWTPFGLWNEAEVSPISPLPHKIFPSSHNFGVSVKLTNPSFVMATSSSILTPPTSQYRSSTALSM